ncbi:aminotransferase-like mobile domain-containing protein, partial [Tanacetum coccineum]
MKTSLSMQSEPGIYTEWSSTDTHKRHYLTIPSDLKLQCLCLIFVLADPGFWELLDLSLVIVHNPVLPLIEHLSIAEWPSCMLFCAAPKFDTNFPICYPLVINLPVADKVEARSANSEEEEDEDNLSSWGKSQQQLLTIKEALQVVLKSPQHIRFYDMFRNLDVPTCLHCETGHLACSRCCSEFKGCLTITRGSMNNLAHMLLHADARTLHAPLMEIDQTTIFLQEQNENVIFILNHEVQEHGRALNIDCVGVGCFKSGFVYQLTAKSMETCLSLRSVPEIYTEWSKDTPRKCNLTVPSGFADYDGLLSLSVCIKKKVIPSEFEEEMKEGRLPAALCNSLTRSHWFIKGKHIFDSRFIVLQCEKGHLSCFSCCSKMKKVCPFCYTSTGCYNYNHCEGLENFFKSVIVPCKNDGCNMAMLLRYQNEHEQVCPHATCFCPYPSCPFTGSHENLYLHFGLKHEADITRFTYGTTFSLCVGINQEYLFLQEEQASVIFILNHQVQLHE